MLQYLGLSQLSLQELQGLSMSLLTVLQGGQLLLHLPLQRNKTTTYNRLVITYWKSITEQKNIVRRISLNTVSHNVKRSTSLLK